MRIALISDTHLTPLAPAFDGNLAAARRWIAGHQVDLTIHLGDVTADAVRRPDEIAHAVQRIAAWPTEMHLLAGNHDIGDNPGAHGEAVAVPASIERFAEAAGPGHWSIRKGIWTLIGIDAQLLGRGDAIEAAQWEWLEEAIKRVAGPTGLFLHKPLFRDGRQDRSTHHRYIAVDARERLLDSLESIELRFVASGHTHQSRSLHIDGVEHRWIPSTAFVLPDAAQERIGLKEVGMTLLTLESGFHRFETFCPEGMVQHDLADHPDAYPDHAARLREIANARDT
ncbi:metallophosphoesterase family protein [Sphingobium chungbukense]|uniref:metallophosphoesterase family protein n=1 Tax=Sphingobium chungbukense TaxID=56193 RepID=UPI00069A780E|nr:metallophosphoesterase [Sphingobium chungbukense]